jgi:hypothetical protein
MPIHHDCRGLCGALAEELRDTSRQVEQLAATLALDEQLLDRFLQHLQSFDLIAQRIGEGAALLDRLAGGSSTDAALDSVRLERMQERLRAAIVDPALLGQAALSDTPPAWIPCRQSTG